MIEFKTENEKPCIVSIHKNGTLNNAASSLDVLLTNMILEEEDKVSFPGRRIYFTNDAASG